MNTIILIHLDTHRTTQLAFARRETEAHKIERRRVRYFQDAATGRYGRQVAGDAGLLIIS